MNEKTINEQYAYIRSLLEEKRLKEALMQLESLLWQCTDWDLRNRMEQLTNLPIGEYGVPRDNILMRRYPA